MRGSKFRRGKGSDGNESGREWGAVNGDARSFRRMKTMEEEGDRVEFR